MVLVRVSDRWIDDERMIIQIEAAEQFAQSLRIKRCTRVGNAAWNNPNPLSRQTNTIDCIIRHIMRKTHHTFGSPQRPRSDKSDVGTLDESESFRVRQWLQIVQRQNSGNSPNCWHGSAGMMHKLTSVGS
jgi:hypothetical protein